MKGLGSLPAGSFAFLGEGGGGGGELWGGYGEMLCLIYFGPLSHLLI